MALALAIGGLVGVGLGLLAWKRTAPRVLAVLVLFISAFAGFLDGRLVQAWERDAATAGVLGMARVVSHGHASCRGADPCDLRGLQAASGFPIVGARGDSLVMDEAFSEAQRSDVGVLTRLTAREGFFVARGIPGKHPLDAAVCVDDSCFLVRIGDDTGGRGADTP